MAETPKVPTILIAGQEWPVPVLAPRQNRDLIPLFNRCIPKVNETRKASLIDPEDEAKGVNAWKWTVALVESGAYEEMCQIITTAITRATPDFTREQFDNLPVEAGEMLASLPVIGRQAGLLRG